MMLSLLSKKDIKLAVETIKLAHKNEYLDLIEFHLV